MSDARMGDRVRMEAARPEHLPEILALMAAGAVGARVGRDTTRTEDYTEAFAAMLAAPELEVWVALEPDGRVAGSFQIHFLRGLGFGGGIRAEVESVHTRADLRGQGIGSVMMAHAELRARARRACLIQLTSNRLRVDAHRFYDRLGFDQSHLGFKKML